MNKDEVGENESEEMEKKKEPNNSLISSLVTHKEGDRLSRRGYWGDIVTGPFIPFGHEYKKEVSSRSLHSTLIYAKKVQLWEIAAAELFASKAKINV